MIRKWSCGCYRAGVSLEVQNMLLPALSETDPDTSKWIQKLTLQHGSKIWGWSQICLHLQFSRCTLEKAPFPLLFGYRYKAWHKVLSMALKVVSSLSPHQSTNLRFPLLKVASSYYMSKNTDDLCQTYRETRCLCWHINTKNCYHRKISPSKPGLKLIWTDIQRPQWVTFVHTRICLLRDFLVHVNWLPDGID